MSNSARMVAVLVLAARGLHWRNQSRAAPTVTAGEAMPHPPVSRTGWIKLIVIAVATALGAGALYIYDQTQRDAEQLGAAVSLTGGDPVVAPALIVRYGCAGCHTIPGIPEADGQIGPALNNLARQGYVGGVLPNSTDNLIAWIVDPRAIDPMSAMPRTGISRGEARDVAAYLLSLRN